MEESKTKKTTPKPKPQGHHGGHECGGCGGCGGHQRTAGPTKATVTQMTPEGPTNWEEVAKYKAAELDNYIKRTKDAIGNAFNDGRAQVLVQILPLLDALVEAQKTVQTAADKEGLEILVRKFEETLVRLGMEVIPVKKGDKFDPYIHSCMSAAADNNEKILEVYQKGYRFAGRVVRPALVKI